MRKRGASDMDDDATLHVHKRVPFQNTGKLVSLVIFEGQMYFVVDSLASIVSPTRSVRKLVCDDQLNVVGPCNDAWEWLRVEGEWERVMLMDHATTYAEYLAEAGLITEEMALEVDEWAVDLYYDCHPVPSPPLSLPRVDLDELIQRRAAAKRRAKESDKGKEEEVEWEEDSSSVAVPERMEEEEEDGEEYDDAADALLEVPPLYTFQEVERLTAVNLQMIKASAIMQQQLPRDHPTQLELQVSMHNAYAVLEAMHPVTMVPGESHPYRLPELPSTGVQVRVGQRAAALGYDRPTREQYQEIGSEAARLYRAAGIAGPWKVVGWRGGEREDRYYYTTQTQRFIDEAIETVMG